MATITIDGKTIHADENLCVLEAALQNGIYIPHLCHHPDLPDLGACRLCVVECAGEAEPVPSCMLQVRDGLQITTKSERVDHLRRLAMELLLAAHPEDCSACPKYGRCELQTLIQYMNVSATRMHTRVKGFAEKEQPLLIHDMNRCILCGRCVRVCDSVRGVQVLQYNKQEMETYIGTLHDRLLKDADCRFCGACAEVCPTGSIRDAVNYTATEKRDALIPCHAACPVHTDVPRYVRYVKESRYAEATAAVHERLPFPECLGHVCAHPCEAQCRRGEVNEAISIRNIKRFAAEHDNNLLWKKNQKRLPATGKRVCVVGGGPAGMTAAFYLAKQGHAVTLCEAFPKLGGQMQYGIPSYRLPRDVVDREAGYLAEVGVEIRCGDRVQKPLELKKDYDAVVLAIGTHKGVRLPMPGNDLPGVLLNTDFLRNASMGSPTGLGERVVVLGGGNVAFDCARTAKRLGAKEIHVACLEAREAMTADEEEILQAQAEGIAVHPAQTFEAILGEKAVTGVSFMNVKSFRFDENHRAVIEKEEDSLHQIAADTVIFAVGQRAEIDESAGLPLGRGNSIQTTAPDSAATATEGIFACGDVVYGTKTVIQAVASGRDAASETDRFLGGTGDISEVLAPRETPDGNIGRVEGFAALSRKQPEILAAESRCDNFRMVDKGLPAGEVCGEAARCLQCDLRFQLHPGRIWSDYNTTQKEVSAQ